MDFKTRFQGKTSKITKDGGIDSTVLTSAVPISKVDRVTVNGSGTEGLSQLISFGHSVNTFSYNQPPARKPPTPL
jgi:hypothetical protein